MIAKLAIVACIAQWLSGLTAGKVNMLVICLILGVIFRAVGFLDEGSLTKANGFTFVIGGVLTNVFASLANTTPSQLVSMIVPLIIIFIVGLGICALVAILVGKLLGESWYMSFALGVTALFGFPGTLIVPTEVANAVGENEAEVEMLKKHLIPKMIIAGMVSVSVVSVVFAGIMAAWA
jgi:Na+/glutamate symporter